MTKLFLPRKSILGSLHLIVAVIALSAMTMGCLTTTEPTDVAQSIANGVSESFSMVPSGDEVDEAMFAVSTKPVDVRSDNRQGGGLFHQLDLTKEQIAEIRAAFSSACAELSRLAEQLNSGGITEEEYIVAAKAVHVVLHETIWNILTAEQQAIVDGKLTLRLIERLSKRIENGTDRINRRVRHLTRALDLDEQQQSDITAILQEGLESMVAIRDALVDGTTDRLKAREDISALYQSIKDTVGTILTDEQREQFDGRNRDRHRNRRIGGRC